MASILILEDTTIHSEMLVEVLQANDHVAYAVTEAEEALKLYAENGYDVVISDINMEPMDGLTFLKKLKDNHPEAVVVMMTAYPNSEYAVKAFHAGAVDFLQKPVNFNLLVKTIKRAIEISQMGRGTSGGGSGGPVSRSVRKDDRLRDYFSGNNKKIDTVVEQIESMVGKSQPVLIQGERGTGKRLLADFLYQAGPNSSGSRVYVNVADYETADLRERLIGERHTGGSWISEASRGTLILHNIDRLPVSIQGDLSEVLKKNAEKLYVICTSSADLDALLEEEKFSENLFFQIAMTLPVNIPPLRERIDDLGTIVRQITNDVEHPVFKSIDIKFADSALALMRQYEWRRNVTELRQVVSAAVSATETKIIGLNQLPMSLRQIGEWPTLLQYANFQVEQYCKSVLNVTMQDRKKSAEILGISETLLDKIEQGVHGLADTADGIPALVEGGASIASVAVPPADHSDSGASEGKSEGGDPLGEAAFIFLDGDDAKNRIARLLVNRFKYREIASKDNLEGALTIKASEDKIKALVFENKLTIHSYEYIAENLGELRKDASVVILAANAEDQSMINYTVVGR